MPRKSRNTRKKADISKIEAEVNGYIEKVIFPRWGQESKNGFAILALHIKGGASGTDGTGVEPETVPDGSGRFRSDEFGNDPNRIVAKGTYPHPREGDEVLLKGRWIEDPQYGRQFQFSEFEIVLPTSQQGVVAYFSSGKFYGLGPAAAHKIIDALGENCLNLLAANPDLAYDIPTLSEKQKVELAEKMADHGVLGDLIALICRHGIGTSTAGRIYAHYGPHVLDVVKENPYQLIRDVDGIGFDKADKIGVSVGIKRNSDYRIEAAVRHVLEEAKHEGHVAVRSARVTDLALKLLGEDSGVGIGDVVRVGRGLVESGELVRENNKEKKIDLIYLPGMYEAETGLANRLKQMVGVVDGVNDEIIEEMITSLEVRMRLQYPWFNCLDPEQRNAVRRGIKYRASVITGPPGSGKSTILHFINTATKSLFPDIKIFFVAPTGRAAKRICETTGADAMTIHAQLGYVPGQGFTFDQYNQLPGPAVLTSDEFSMTDLELGYSLVQAIPDNMRLIIVGDVNQLPSVGPGMVLRDIIESGAVPVTRLNFIHRTDEGSTISMLANMINNYDRDKVMPNLRELERQCGGRDFRFFEAHTPEDANRVIKELMQRQKDAGMGLLDFQVLTPLKKRTAAGAYQLNEMLREIFNPPLPGLKEKKYGDKLFRDGDKVMWVNRNDRRRGLSNGDIGVLRVGNRGCVLDLDGREIVMTGEDLSNVEHALAFTTHKAQGSESDFVPVVCVKGHYMGGRMLFRSLIYTALTRAKKRLAIVGTQGVFELAVKNNRIEKRFGLLRERLQGVI